MKMKLTAWVLCLALCAVTVLFASCRKPGNREESSHKNEGFSSGMSRIESDITGKVSDTVSDVTSGFSSIFTPDEESSAVSSRRSSEEGAPTGAPVDIPGADLSGLDALENTKKGWGQGVQVDDQNRPVSCDAYQKKYGKYGGVFILPSDQKSMVLTFDEGYENGYTAQILDTLKEKNCQAVFFVTMPYVKQNPGLIRRMIDEGHVVGNHTVHHKSMPTLSVEEAAKEIYDLHTYVKEQFGYEMTLFRPPMGEWSTRTLELAKRLHYKTVLWSFAYLDYDVNKQMGVEKAFPKVTGASHSGAVYLLHAVSKDNAQMLGDVIDTFRKDGYTLHTRIE